MLLEEKNRQDGSMIFVTLVVNMQHLQTRRDTYNTCNYDTCDTIEVSNFEV